MIRDRWSLPRLMQVKRCSGPLGPNDARAGHDTPGGASTAFHDLRGFLQALEANGRLRRVTQVVDPELESTALEGPFGDHTGYYNAQGEFPVLTVQRMSLRRDAIYHGSYMGRAPHDEPSELAMALNDLFVPILRRVFPEIVDFYLPPAACSYRVALVSIRKQYPGHARRVMMGVWSYLRQFTYTKFVVVTDDDVDVRDGDQVAWAVSTRVDPARDAMLVENTPIDYLDFASPTPGLGSKLGLDATNKWPGETTRDWGRPIAPDAAVERRVNALWQIASNTPTACRSPRATARRS